MCIIFYSTQHEDYDLILIANRDEYLSRPTALASIHTNFSSTPILSGIDLIGGGTWLGISLSPTLRFATLTNFAEELPPSTIPLPSRGNLVKDYLTLENLDSYLTNLEQTKSNYAGFNLLYGQLSSAGFRMDYLTNREEAEIISTDSVATEKVVGLSNGTIDSKDWMKVNYGCEAFSKALETKSKEDLISQLYSILTTAHADPITQRSDLRKSILIRPIPLSPTLSPPSISTTSAPRFHPDPTILTAAEKEPKGNWYGTRSQTILFISRAREGKRRVELRERTAFELEEGGGVRWSGVERVESFEI